MTRGRSQYGGPSRPSTRVVDSRFHPPIDSYHLRDIALPPGSHWLLGRSEILWTRSQRESAAEIGEEDDDLRGRHFERSTICA